MVLSSDVTMIKGTNFRVIFLSAHVKFNKELSLEIMLLRAWVTWVFALLQVAGHAAGMASTVRRPSPVLPATVTQFPAEKSANLNQRQIYDLRTCGFISSSQGE